MVAADARVPAHMMVSDASGGWGCGAEWDGRWFQIQWQGLGKTQGRALAFSIMAKELLPIGVVVAVWGPSWAGNLVRAKCNNMSVVATVNSGSCREPDAIHLRRCLAFLEARWSCQVKAVHIPGVKNVVADALSRNRANVAFVLIQGARVEPEVVPNEVLRAVARGCDKVETWNLLWPGSWSSECVTVPKRPTERHGLGMPDGQGPEADASSQ